LSTSREGRQESKNLPNNEQINDASNPRYQTWSETSGITMGSTMEEGLVDIHLLNMATENRPP